MTQPIKIVFLGTPEFSCPFLSQLANDSRFDLLAVITQEDKKIGRKQILTPPPVKQLAIQLNLPIFQTEKLNKDFLIIDKIKELQPDFLVVIAFGQILSTEILAIPKIKAINVHGSILPKYRGASPIEQVLLNGDSKTGLSVMEMVKAMDAGPVYQTYELPISTEDNNQILREKLSKLGSEKLPSTLIEIYNGTLQSHSQIDSEATFCNKISKEDGLINPTIDSAETIFNKYRAFSNWPGLYLKIQNKILKLHKVNISEQKLPPGKFQFDNQNIYLGTTTKAIQIVELQLEGKTQQSSKVFLQGNSNLFI